MLFEGSSLFSTYLIVLSTSEYDVFSTFLFHFIISVTESVQSKMIPGIMGKNVSVRHDLNYTGLVRFHTLRGVHVHMVLTQSTECPYPPWSHGLKTHVEDTLMCTFS